MKFTEKKRRLNPKDLITVLCVLLVSPLTLVRPSTEFSKSVTFL